MSNSTPPGVEEFTALLQALRETPASAATACPEWTVHDVAAHLTGAYEEVTRHVLAYADGSPLTSTRTFEVREQPWRALDHEKLLDALVLQEAQMREAIADVLDREPDARLRWTGRWMKVAWFPTHLRSECALHRWDIVGEDEWTGRLLADYRLFAHAVTAIGAGPMTAKGVLSPGLSARLRSPGHPDLVVEIGTEGSGGPVLTLAEPAGVAALEADQAARLLLLWGRQPEPAARVRLTGDPADARALRELFAGY